MAVSSFSQPGVDLLRLFAVGDESEAEKVNQSLSRTQAIIEFCVEAKIQPSQVCDGMVNEMGPTFWPIFTKITLPARQICQLLGACPPNTTKVPLPLTLSQDNYSSQSTQIQRLGDLMTQQLHRWNNSEATPDKNEDKNKKEPEPQPNAHLSPLKAKGSTTTTTQSGYFIHLSDVHYDPRYLPGSQVHCPEPLCCRNATVTSSGPGASPWGTFFPYCPFRSFPSLFFPSRSLSFEILGPRQGVA